MTDPNDEQHLEWLLPEIVEIPEDRLPPPPKEETSE